MSATTHREPLVLEPSELAERSRRRWRAWRVPFIALCLCVAGLTAMVVGSLLQVGGHRAVPITGVFAFGLVGFALATQRASLHQLGRDSVLLSATALVLSAPLTWMMASWALGQPIVESHWRCGTGDAVMMILAPILVALSSLIATVIASVLTAGRRLLRTERWVAPLAWLAIIAASLLSLASLRRATRFPEPEKWLASQPVVGHISVGAWHDRTVERDPLSATVDPSATETVEHARVGDIAAVRVCRGSNESCAIAVEGAHAAPGLAWSAQSNQSITVQRDAKHGYVLFSGPGRPWTTAYQGQNFVSYLGVGALADTLSPPPAWIATSMIGVAFALWLMKKRADIGRGISTQHAQSAQLVDDYLELQDGSRLPCPSPAPAAHGIVTVFAHPAMATHRAGQLGAVLAVHPGTVDEVFAELALRRATYAMLTLATIALSSGALVVCTLRGIVFG